MKRCSCCTYSGRVTSATSIAKAFTGMRQPTGPRRDKYGYGGGGGGGYSQKRTFCWDTILFLARKRQTDRQTLNFVFFIQPQKGGGGESQPDGWTDRHTERWDRQRQTEEGETETDTHRGETETDTQKGETETDRGERQTHREERQRQTHRGGETETVTQRGRDRHREGKDRDRREGGDKVRQTEGSFTEAPSVSR